MNHVILIGNLGKDPEVKQAGGQSVCRFSLATTERWKNKSGEKQERTDWHNITVWGKLGDLCQQFLKKGSQACVVGRIRYDEYEKDGVKKYRTEIIASDVRFLDRRGAAAGDPTSAPASDSEEVPF